MNSLAMTSAHLEPDSASADAPAAGGVRRFLVAVFAPSIWLTGRLSFTRKYLLIGLVVMVALGSLSVPLWQKLRQDRHTAEQGRAGLRGYVTGTELLATLVQLRDDAVMAGPFDPGAAEIVALDATITRLTAPAGQLRPRWQQLRGLDASARPQARFAAFNGVINALLAQVQSDAQAYRLHLDPELDATFAMLITRLPQLIDTLGKQQAAARIEGGEMAPYVLGAQVFLTEAAPELRESLAPLLALHLAAVPLRDALDDLLAGIGRQQDAADKTQDSPYAWVELSALATSNEALALRFLRNTTAAADAHLRERIDKLQQTEWIIGGLLVGALAALSWLFAGMYLSTRQSLGRLSRGTAAFIAGRFDTRIHMDTQDELVLVARNFNTVAAEFGRLLDVIREQNESRERELAALVQVRTAELAEKNEQLVLVGQRAQNELLLARDMQRAILPQEFPDRPEWSVHACMYPARELGGDFYDVFQLPDGRCGVLVADVSGKGAAAAFFMAVSRTVLLDLAMTGLAPARVLARANDLLCRHNPMEMFVTVAFGVFDPRDGSLVYASAGHPAPLLRRADGVVEALPGDNDLALAIMSEMHYSERHARLAPGDTLLLYTDGVTEAFALDGSAYGDDGLQAWFASTGPAPDPALVDDAQATPGRAQALVQSLVDDVNGFVAGAEASDDLTCLILYCKPGERHRSKGDPAMTSLPVDLSDKVLLLEHSLPARLARIEVLADAVSEALPDRPDLAFSANLCLEELITNIIRHGLAGESDRQINVRMSITPEWLEIILKDDAPPFDPFVEAPEPDLDADIDDRPIGGLGVHLVKTLMDDARAYYDGSGNLIVLLKTLAKAD